MLDVIQYDDIKKYKKYFPFDVNNSSKLYYDKDRIHKIPHFIKTDFYGVLQYIDRCNLNELIELKNLIYKDNVFVGYSFYNYKEYKSLMKFKNRKINLKKDDCYKIIDSFYTLALNNLSYWDYHRGNVLLNKKTGEIKICDLDRISIISDVMESQLKKTVILCLAYLYNLSYDEINRVLFYDMTLNKDRLINNLFKEITYSRCIEFFNKIDLDLIMEERQKIKKLSWELNDFGYYEGNWC